MATDLIGRFHELFDLDRELGLLRRKVGRGATKAGSVAGYKDDLGYLQVIVDGRRQRVHRVIFAMAYGYLPKEVDHINGLKVDNRPENLRAATQAENQQNQRLTPRNRSGVKGVCWHRATSKWRAQCRAFGREYHLGLFADITEAAAAVRAFREKHHEEFARHE